TTNSLGARPKGPLLGPLQASVPIVVYTGPQRADGGAGLQVASAPKRKRPAISVAKGPDGKPSTANASAGFAPASASTKPVAAPEDAKSKSAAKKPADKKAAAKKPEAKTADSKSGGAQAKSSKQ